jgi:hypothetical protein
MTSARYQDLVDEIWEDGKMDWLSSPTSSRFRLWGAARVELPATKTPWDRTLAATVLRLVDTMTKFSLAHYSALGLAGWAVLGGTHR